MNYSMSMAALVLFWCLLVKAASGYSPLRFSSWNRAPHRGFVQILLDQEWLDVGSSNWTTNESAVVCRQLGYIESVGILDESYFCSSSRSTTIRRFFTDVKCTGEEKALSECHFSVEYTNSTDLPSPRGVICAVPFSLRLGNVSSQAPNLEVLIDYNWHLFCGEMFNQSHATVACRQLGYEYGQYTEIDMTTGSFAYVDGYCSGHEYNLISCESDLHDPLVLTDQCNTSVSLQCFSPPSRPCQVEFASQTTCDSISISWTFPKPVVDSYYIRYRPSNIINSSWIQMKELNTNMSTTAIATITYIDPFTSYEVTLHGSNEYGNGPLSDPIIVSLELPSLPLPTSLQLISVSAEGVNISWEFQELSCSLLCLIGFDVRLTTMDNVVTHTYNISQLTSSSHLHYSTMISGLQGMATYYLKVRAFGKLAVNKQCIGKSQAVYGIYSDIVEVTTPHSDNSGIFDLILFNNPYISLSVFIVACTLVVVLLVLIIVCGCCISFRQCCRRKPKRIYQRRISTSDDNIYAAGDLTEQTYVPMSSSSVPNSLRIINRQISSTASITNGPRSLWIDFPQPLPTTTFETPEHNSNDNKENTSHQTDGKSDSEDDDNPYDEIAKVQADHHNNQTQDSIIDMSGEDEDEENVYDEIHGKGEEEDSIASLKQDVEVDNLPEAHRLSQINYSQDSTDGQALSPTLPPPMAFSALPPVPTQSVEHNERANRLKGKGLSISMCNIPLPPLPTNSNTSRTINRNVSEGHWNTSNDDQRFKSRNRRQTVNTDTREKHRRHQRERRMSIDHTKARSFDKQEDKQRMRTMNTQATSFEQQEDCDTEGPYYSVPPRDIISDMRQLSRDQEREKSPSPEYEILLHPQSSALVAASTKVVKSRPSRPPPPVPVIKRNPPTPLALMTQISQERKKDY